VARKVIILNRGSKRRLKEIGWKTHEVFSLVLLAVFLLAMSVFILVWEVQHEHPRSEPPKVPQVTDTIFAHKLSLCADVFPLVSMNFQFFELLAQVQEVGAVWIGYCRCDIATIVDGGGVVLGREPHVEPGCCEPSRIVWEGPYSIAALVRKLTGNLKQ
jgi:hypothetical protein